MTSLPIDPPSDPAGHPDNGIEGGEFVLGPPRPPVENEELTEEAERDPAMATACRFTVNLDTSTAQAWPPTNISATINPRDLSPEQLRKMSELWEDSLEADASPLVTLKGNSMSNPPRADLVIQPRRLRKTDQLEEEQADYELLNLVGEGGVGLVYSARQASIDRTVAIKMLRADITDDFQHREKFLSEAVVTGDLDHPNIVPVYDVGTTNQGELFYSMKLVRGTPWSSVINDKPLTENLEILLKVADAIAFAHAREVVHRDIKPENVMLGDFGEVLVMDWGNAVSSALFRAASGRARSVGMGGTPAYMAPEMATGPVEDIGMASDVYLLGAVLYEVVTGTPPHAGADVVKCLRAAARNEIRPTTKTGELLEIALRAMATDPRERPQTVQAFQEAVRTYQSHSESIGLSTRAEEDLAAAKDSNDYELFARARFAFAEALLLWDENHRARDGLFAANVAYAGCALEKGDFDLGLSVLDPADSRQTGLRESLQHAQNERSARQHRLKTLRRLAALLVLLILGTVSGFLLVVAEKNERLNETTQNALEEKERADEETEKAIAEKTRADEETNRARLAEKMAVVAEMRARSEKENAVYESYLARIGLAAAKIDENAFSDAMRILEEYESSHLRHWEWARLKYFEGLSSQTVAHNAPVDSVAYSPQGDPLAQSDDIKPRYAVGLRRGVVEIWQAGDDEYSRRFETGGDYVFDVAFSPDGRYVATATDAAPYVTLWDTATGQPLRWPSAGSHGHSDWALSVEFSADGTMLLTGSYDKTAIIWEVATGRPLRKFARHSRAVWDATMSPDQNTVVTVSEDRTAIVWRAKVSTAIVGRAEDWTTKETTSQQIIVPKFTGHSGPIYAAAFSPDGQYVATAGHDQDVLLWNPAKIEPPDFDNVLSQESQRPAAEELVEGRDYHALKGHTGTIRSLAFSADGKMLLSGSQDNTLRVWNVATRNSRTTLRGHSRSVSSCAFAPNSRDVQQVLSGSHDATAKIWHVEKYAEHKVLQARVLTGHQDAVLAATFDHQGKRIVTASRDQTARIWDLEQSGVETPQGKILREGHELVATRARMFPGGKWLLTAAMDNTVRIWNVRTGTELWELTGTGRNTAVALSDDSRWLLTASDSRAAKVWDLSGLQRGAARPDSPHELKRDSRRGSVTAVALSRGDGRYLVAGDEFGWCTLWERQTGGETPRFERRWSKRRHSEGVVAAAILPNSKWLITASRDGGVRVSMVDSGDAGPMFEVPGGQAGGVTAMALSSEGNTLVTAYSNGDVRVWEVATQRRLRLLQGALGGPATVAGNVRRQMEAADWSTADLAERLKLSPADLTAVSSGQLDPDGPVLSRLADAFDVDVAALRRPLTNAVDISPDGKKLITSNDEDGAVRFWEIGTGREIRDTVHDAVGLAVLSGAGSSAVFAPDGDHIVVVSGRGARLWDLAAREVVRTFSPHSAVSLASFSSDDQYVVTASWDHTVRIWNAETMLAERQLSDPTMSAVNSAVFSPDGRLVLTASDDGRARLWDRHTGELVRDAQPIRHEAPIRFATFSPNGRLIVTASEDETSCIWDATNGGALHRLDGHRAAVLCAGFSQDSHWLVTGSRDQEARLWDVASGRSLAVMQGHRAPVNSVAFSPDRRRILTGSDDHTAKLWDTRIDDASVTSLLREVLTLAGHEENVVSASFSPNGQNVLTAGRDARVILWPAVYIPPSIHLSAETRTLANALTPLAPKAEISAPNSPVFRGGRLVVQLSEPDSASDAGRIVLVTQDDRAPIHFLNPRQLAFRFAQDAESVAIGTLSEDRDGRRLEIVFNENANSRIAEAVLRQIAFQPDGVFASSRTVTFQLVDGQGSSSEPRSVRIQSGTPASDRGKLAVDRGSKVTR